MVSIELNDHFSKKRFTTLLRFSHKQGLENIEEAFQKYDVLAYSRMLERQETLKQDLLSYVQKSILA